MRQPKRRSLAAILLLCPLEAVPSHFVFTLCRFACAISPKQANQIEFLSAFPSSLIFLNGIWLHPEERTVVLSFPYPSPFSMLFTSIVFWRVGSICPYILCIQYIFHFSFRVADSGAFFGSLILGIALHYKKIVKNEYYGYPQEWFPSVSATIGNSSQSHLFIVQATGIQKGTYSRY